MVIDIKTLYPGTKVKVVDQWPLVFGFNHNPEMDRHLGQVVTIQDVDERTVHIKEDDEHKHWSVRCFEYVVEDSVEDSEV